MAKRKTTLLIDEHVWQEFAILVVQITGSARKLSEETEKALIQYIKTHQNPKIVAQR